MKIYAVYILATCQKHLNLWNSVHFFSFSSSVSVSSPRLHVKSRIDCLKSNQSPLKKEWKKTIPQSKEQYVQARMSETWLYVRRFLHVLFSVHVIKKKQSCLVSLENKFRNSVVISAVEQFVPDHNETLISTKWTGARVRKSLVPWDERKISGGTTRSVQWKHSFLPTVSGDCQAESFASNILRFSRHNEGKSKTEHRSP